MPDLASLMRGWPVSTTPEFNYIPLSDLPAALAEQGATATYHQCWRRAADGRIPAQRFSNVWFVAKSDLPAIAALFPAK